MHNILTIPDPDDFGGSPLHDGGMSDIRLIDGTYDAYVVVLDDTHTYMHTIEVEARVMLGKAELHTAAVSMCADCTHLIHNVDPGMGGEFTFAPGKCDACGRDMIVFTFDY